jgi:hypothetical protein
MRSLSVQDAIDQLPSTTVVIAHNDPRIALELANDLRLHAARVIVTENATSGMAFSPSAFRRRDALSLVRPFKCLSGFDCCPAATMTL